MLRDRRGVLLACIIAMLVLPMPGLDGEEARASPPPPSGDWTVTDATSISDTTIVLSGNLTVMPGGILTLNRVVLVVDCSLPGQFRIDVMAGGELHLRQSNLTASNVSQKFDFMARPGSVLEMTQSEIHGAGSRWTEPAATSGIMVRTSAATFTDTLFSQNTVALDIRDCSPTVSGCTFTGNLAGVVAYNSSMVFRDCRVEGTKNGGLLLHDRTDITVSGCSFTDNFRWAIFANRSSVTLLRNTFFLNYISVFSEDSAALRLENNTFDLDRYIAVTVYRCPSVVLGNDTIAGATRMALRAESSRFVAVNSTLASGLYDLQLNGNSTGELVNCSFTPRNIDLLDPKSRLNVSWFLGALVRWWSSGAPVAGAEVTVTNGTGNLTARGTTDAQGRFDWAVALEYTRDRSVSQPFGPYNVTARRLGLARTVEATVNRSVVVDLLLDDIGPVIKVEQPRAGAFLNLTRVTLKGQCWDNETRVVSVECRVDNGSFASASGTSFWEFTTGVLPNGPHNVTVRARDSSNNTNQAVVPFTLDTFAPSLTVLSPPEGGFTREDNVTVDGATERDATVTVNGTPANMSAGSGAFNLTVGLSEGDNFIEVVATDRAGNSAVRVLRFRRDTMVTPVEIFPENGTWTNQTQMRIFGRVEENSTLLVRAQDPSSNFTSNGTRLNTTTGNFSVTVALQNGTNLFRIDILDAYGNNATRYLTVLQDSSPPFLNITSPPEPELHTRLVRLMLEGRTEPGADLFLNGRRVLVEDGNFSKALTLDLGVNVLNLTVVDAAGNSFSTVYTAILDRTPPPLELASPRRTASGTPLATESGDLRVRGTTEAGAQVYISVNGRAVNGGRPVAVDAFGGFRRDVKLREGYNTIEVTAMDRAGNPTVETRVVRYRPPPPLVSNELLAALIVVIGIVVAVTAVVARDTKRSTGRWGLRRPAWFRIPPAVRSRAAALRAFVPRPEFGREEGEAGIGAVSAEPGKQAEEPQPAGAPPPGAPQAPGGAGAAAPGPPVPPGPAGPPVGKEFSVSEKPSGAPSVQPIPGATELPVAEPASGAAPAGAPAIGALAPPAPPGGPAPAPAAPVAPPPPPEPPKPKEVDPLAEILGVPTRKL